MSLKKETLQILKEYPDISSAAIFERSKEAGSLDAVVQLMSTMKGEGLVFISGKSEPDPKTGRSANQWRVTPAGEKWLAGAEEKNGAEVGDREPTRQKPTQRRRKKAKASAKPKARRARKAKRLYKAIAEKHTNGNDLTIQTLAIDNLLHAGILLREVCNDVAEDCALPADFERAKASYDRALQIHQAAKTA